MHYHWKSKIVKIKILRNAHFTIFDSHLNYYYIVWAQNNTNNRLIILQKKAQLIMNDQSFHSSPLFSENNILKFGGKITLC